MEQKKIVKGGQGDGQDRKSSDMSLQSLLYIPPALLISVAHDHWRVVSFTVSVDTLRFSPFPTCLFEGEKKREDLLGKTG